MALHQYFIFFKYNLFLQANILGGIEDTNKMMKNINLFGKIYIRVTAQDGLFALILWYVEKSILRL